MTHLLSGAFQRPMRVGQFRAVIKDKIDMAGISGDAAEGSSLATGEPEDDHFRVDRVEDLLGLRRFPKNQLAQRERQVRDAWRTACQEIEELCARLSHKFHLSKVIGSPGKTIPASLTEA
jgi:hypothetical protein